MTQPFFAFIISDYLAIKNPELTTGIGVRGFSPTENGFEVGAQHAEPQHCYPLISNSFPSTSSTSTE